MASLSSAGLPLQPAGRGPIMKTLTSSWIDASMVASGYTLRTAAIATTHMT